MNKTNFLYLLTILFITLAGCSGSNDDDEFSFGVGKYKFVMSDSSGKKMAEGTLNVKTKKSNEISGVYEFTKIYKNDFPGLSSMNGEFAGNIVTKDNTVFINTNPKIADSNVFWNMKIGKSSVFGGWNYSTLRGAATGGKVKITK